MTTDPTTNPANLHSFGYLDELLAAPFGWTKNLKAGDRVFLVAKFASAVTIYHETSIRSIVSKEEAPAGIEYAEIPEYSFRFFAEFVDSRPALVADDGEDSSTARLYAGTDFNAGVIASMRDQVTRAALLEELVRKLNSGVMGVDELARIVSTVSPQNVAKIVSRRADPLFVTLHP